MRVSPVEAKSRVVTIFKSELNAVRPQELDLTIHCSKGTYIRSIVDELGQLLGCGAAVSKLHRTQHGPFVLAGAIDPEASDAEAVLAAMLPVDAMIMDWPAISLDEAQTIPFVHGNPAGLTDGYAVSETQYRVFEKATGLLVGIGQVKRLGEIDPIRVINCNS